MEGCQESGSRRLAGPRWRRRGAGLYAPAMDPLEGARGVEITAGGRRLVAFAGCDYLGLAHHPDVVAVSRRALDRFGVGASASRTTTGTAAPHVELESALARWLGFDDAVVTASGFLASALAVKALSKECG